MWLTPFLLLSEQAHVSEAEESVEGQSGVARGYGKLNDSKPVAVCV